MLVCFDDTATTEIYTLSLHDALPICTSGIERLSLPAERLDHVARDDAVGAQLARGDAAGLEVQPHPGARRGERVERSEEHTSELQSRQYLVCRLLLEKT